MKDEELQRLIGSVNSMFMPVFVLNSEDYKEIRGGLSEDEFSFGFSSRVGRVVRVTHGEFLGRSEVVIYDDLFHNLHEVDSFLSYGALIS